MGGNAQHIGNYLEHGAVLTQQNPIKATHFLDSLGVFFKTIGFLTVHPWGLILPFIVSEISLIVELLESTFVY